MVFRLVPLSVTEQPFPNQSIKDYGLYYCVFMGYPFPTKVYTFRSDTDVNISSVPKLWIRLNNSSR